MADFLDELISLLTDVARCLTNRRLSWKLVTRDHVTAVRSRDLWFWSKHWQRDEGEAEADLRAGHYAEFGHVEDLIAALNDDPPDVVVSALRGEPARGEPAQPRGAP